MHLLSGGVVLLNNKDKPRAGRRHRLQVSSLGQDMEKLHLAERKEEVIKEVVENSNEAVDDEKKLVR